MCPILLPELCLPFVSLYDKEVLSSSPGRLLPSLTRNSWFSRGHAQISADACTSNFIYWIKYSADLLETGLFFYLYWYKTLTQTQRILLWSGIMRYSWLTLLRGSSHLLKYHAHKTLIWNFCVKIKTQTTALLIMIWWHLISFVFREAFDYMTFLIGFTLDTVSDLRKAQGTDE